MNTSKTAILFPGQGSQYVGMGREFACADPAAMAIFDLTDSVCGVGIKELCFSGPLEELTVAANLQPALTAVNLVCWQALHQAGIKVDYVVGHSLGEYAALHAAGVLTMADTIRLVARRGQVMGQAGERSPGGMVAILGLGLTTVQEILAEVAAPEAISIGNYNSEQQLVLSGSAEALQRASDLAVAKGGKAVALNVSVANHSPLMAQAVPEFEQALAATPMQPPTIPVLFNVTARPEEDPEAIRAIMARQIVSMVRWQEIITALLAAGVETLIECGPKKVLSGLMKRMLPKGGGHRCLQFETPAGLADTISAMAGGEQGRA